MRHPVDSHGPLALLERPPLRHLLEILNGNGEETRIVGGALRNALIGRPVTEVDLATTASPEQVMVLAAAAGLKTVPTGIDHGTVTVIVEGEPFEVTSLREDKETDGRRAVVHFGRDFAVDARRRDFTINALSLDLDGQLHDYTEGLADLAARRVRFIGDAQQRIREDYLRILRFFRFFAEYAEDAPDTDGLAASGAERDGLAILSRERVRHELMKILMARRSLPALEIFSEHGFLVRLLGGAFEFGRFARVAADKSSDAVDRLAALAVMVPEDADRLRERLRLSNEEHRRLVAYGELIAVLKSRPAPLDAVAVRRLAAEHGVRILSQAAAAFLGEPLPRWTEDGHAAFQRLNDSLDEPAVFPLRGADFMKRGIAPGPQIGAMLERARQLWFDEGCPTDKTAAEALLNRVLGAD